MSKTPHCVCSHNISSIEVPLKYTCNEMPSPPLPPRTIKTDIPLSKKQWETFPESSNCNNGKLQCNCNRPHSCPADEGSPPIPPKCGAQGYNSSKYQVNKPFDNRLVNVQKRQTREPHRPSRKSNRHNSSDGGKTRKKSRSKSGHFQNDEKSQSLRPSIEQERFFMKNHDNLMDKNCEMFYKTKKELCKISESHEANLVKISMKSTEIARCPVPRPQVHPPDLIPNRSHSSKVIPTATTSDACLKSGSKSRMKKFFGFLMKSKKTAVVDASRTTMVSPDGGGQLVRSPDMPSRPRRSKSLHLISSLSPSTSMHGAMSPDPKTKSTSIFAVISPTTARIKRNLLCISPKASASSSYSHKKQAGTLPLAGPSNVNCNPKSVLSDNCQQRPGITPMTTGRLSPVHLIAAGQILDINNQNINHYNVSHFNCGNVTDTFRAHKHRPDLQEKVGNVNEIETINKPSSAFKGHNHINHPESSQRNKTPQCSNQLTRQHPINQICSCYHYNCSCNTTAYHHFCPPPPPPPPPPPQQIQSTSIVPSCGCMHNIVQFNPNHFHCCNGPQNNVWCLLPCSPEQKIHAKQRSSCSCQFYHHSASPPANFPRQLPPAPSPPAPGISFSNNHQFSRRYQQSYSKTPPPSFHTHQLPCSDDHCYQEYSLNQIQPDNHQKLIISHHQIHQSNSGYHSNCCSGGYQRSPCCHCHSKCPACGSLFYDEYGSQAPGAAAAAAHYNVNDMYNHQCSSTPMSDSVFEQSLPQRSRMFASPNNTDDFYNCHCSCNHTPHRHSETCGRHSTEIRLHSCRNSAHKSSMQPYGLTDRERSSSKRRKNSNHSCHGPNLDPEQEDKHELSRTHHNSPTSNMLPTTSMHLSPDINNINSVNTDSTMSTSINNNSNISNSNNTTMPSSNAIIQNDRKQHHFEPWRKTFHDNMMALRNLGWYWGPLNHLEAENLVQGRPDGTFLVRDSGNEAYFLSLTFRVLGTTYHTRIEYSQGKFSFWSQPESHSAVTIVEFIDKAVAHSVSGKFHYFLQTNTPGQPPMEVSLLYPLSRYQIVQSLQHLSRFIILSNIRRDHVSHLELPQSIKGYLMEKQYYIDCIETFVKITKDSEPLTYEPSGSVIRSLL